jgi:hypothetical protein
MSEWLDYLKAYAEKIITDKQALKDAPPSINQEMNRNQKK